MIGYTAAFPGNANYIDLPATSSSDVKVIVTPATEFGTVAVWSSYENGGWRIYVSDPSFTGQVAYLII